ncbi:MAG: chromosomal replication initiator protein DnaA [Gemmatimonadetes bacterium]|nr:chromosomal replication initiator protein DnaA [Gemmatimonadota bacterium]
MELTASELWTQILDSARSGLPEQSFQTWLSGTLPVALSESELVVEAPSQFHVEWIEDKYGRHLEELAGRILGRPLAISLSSGSPQAPPLPALELGPSGGGPDALPPQGGPPPSHGPPNLNPRYSFTRFVVGNNNQLAAAACRAVAEQPARRYNPLFLYGGVGLGKTHLMHAVGNQILEDNPSLRVVYVPSEQFMNELVTSIQVGKTAAFRRKYRQMDLLLVDDVHFLQGKEATQEEFFHTFNALYDAQKQIVLASDRPPKELQSLEKRLVSRFEWGLVADLRPPDLETRVAILRKKAEDDGLTLDPEVIDFIAGACRSSVRELEGAVIKLLAYSSLTHQEITVGLAQVALQGVSGATIEEPPPLTPESIQKVVARHFHMTPAALASKRRTKDLTTPRHLAMYLIKEMLGLPLVQIGHLFGGRDHSTVIHSIRKIEGLLLDDSAFSAKVSAIREDLERME